MRSTLIMISLLAFSAIVTVGSSSARSLTETAESILSGDNFEADYLWCALASQATHRNYLTSFFINKTIETAQGIEAHLLAETTKEILERKLIAELSENEYKIVSAAFDVHCTGILRKEAKGRRAYTPNRF
ncbi:hypothetical protein ACQU0X_22240 [Pseudovibrio ascidiaceicola]|uniref:hypothetical protein n=1 Tax=Pseudovibrio ascidiaceicola TaxID=285279 RepID=UPI003D3613B8